MGTEDGADRHTVATDRHNAANRIAMRARWRCAVLMIAGARHSVPLEPGADFQIASAAIVRDCNAHLMMRGMHHYRAGLCLAAYHCVRHGRVQTVNLYLQITPPGLIAALVRADMYLDRVALHCAAKLHSQKLAAFVSHGLSVVLVERTLTILAGIYAQQKRPLGNLAGALDERLHRKDRAFTHVDGECLECRMH